jgi:1-acyl-sn-glycerol-3-phosphate acyltransferase
MNLTVFPTLILMTITGILLSAPAFIIFKIATRWETFRIIRLFVWIYGRGWLAIITPFTRFTSVGLKKKRIAPPCIFIINHLSFFDTFFMGALPFSNVCFAVRTWPFKMAWYAPFMNFGGYLDVEGMTWEKILRESKRELSNGAAMLFFPEAHRSRNGKLGRFYSGAFKMAVETGFPVVPLCITGTDEMLPPGRWFLKPARVCLRALPPVDPADFSEPSGHIKMRKVVKGMIAESLYMTMEAGN